MGHLPSPTRKHQSKQHQAYDYTNAYADSHGDYDAWKYNGNLIEWFVKNINRQSTTT